MVAVVDLDTPLNTIPGYSELGIANNTRITVISNVNVPELSIIKGSAVTVDLVTLRQLVGMTITEFKWTPGLGDERLLPTMRWLKSVGHEFRKTVPADDVKAFVRGMNVFGGAYISGHHEAIVISSDGDTRTANDPKIVSPGEVLKVRVYLGTGAIDGFIVLGDYKEPRNE